MIYTKKFNVPKLHLQLYEFCCGAVWGHGGRCALWKTVSDAKSAICKIVFVNEIHGIRVWLGYTIELLTVSS